jgi:glycine hydroxymethyltransferase
VQGTPYFNHIAAKAVFFEETLSREYKARQFKIIENAKRLANKLLDLGYDVVTGGTDNHMVLVNVANSKEVVDKVGVPYDARVPSIAGGIRMGTPIVTRSGMGEKEMDEVSELIDSVLKEVEIKSQTDYEIDESFKQAKQNQVRELCSRFPFC